MSSEDVNIKEIGWRKDLLPIEDVKAEGSSHRSRSKNQDGKSLKKLKKDSSSTSDSGRDSSSSSNSSGSSSSSSGSEDEKRKIKKEKKKRRQEEKQKKREERRKRKAEKKELKRLKKKKRKEEKKLKKLEKKNKKDKSEIPVPPNSCDDFAVPIELMNYKANAPETPEEYQARQSQIRRVSDPETGRTRLIKGDGEVLEEIVSRDRHKEINRQATKGDGEYFQTKTIGWKNN